MSVDFNPLLLEAIQKAHRETLQDVLTSMCRNSSLCATEASRRLLTTQNQVVFGDVVDDQDSLGSSQDEDENEPGEEYDDDEEDKEVKVVNIEEGSEPPTKRLKLDLDTSELLVRFETCCKCQKQFDITKNSSWACRIHPDLLYLDSDEAVWWDADHLPSPRDEEAVRTWPSGFKWECCDGDGASEPCEAGRHEV